MTKPASLVASLVLVCLPSLSAAQETPRPPINVGRPPTAVQPPVAAAVVTPTPQPSPADPSPAPATPATESPRHTVVADDGSVVTTMPNGIKRITRPGRCGYAMVFPDGRQSAVQCMQVPLANPPLPDATTVKWLDAHSDRLLDIARTLLSNDQASIDNYLRNHENPQQSVYDRIGLRMSLVSDLSGP